MQLLSEVEQVLRNGASDPGFAPELDPTAMRTNVVAPMVMEKTPELDANREKKENFCVYWKNSDTIRFVI